MEAAYKLTEDNDGWALIMDYLVANYKPGELIPHALLWQKFLLKKPDIKDFSTTQDYENTADAIQFAYMSLVEKMREDILETYHLYLANERGKGYRFLLPWEQVAFAFSEMIRTIKKALKEGFKIATNRRITAISQEQQAKDSDMLASMGMIRRLFSGLK